MNYAGVKQELCFLSDIIGLLDGAISSVGDAADLMESQKLHDSANSIERAIELLVTKELELERVADVMNNFDYQHNNLYKRIDLNKCEVNVCKDTIQVINGSSHIYFHIDELDLSRIKYNNVSEFETQ